MKTQKSQHTPGPWVAEDHMKNGMWAVLGQEYTVENEFGDYIRPVVVSVMGGGKRPFNTQTEANARLIAAAPELLEVAKIAAYIATNPSEANELCDWEKGGYDGPLQLLEEKARAAIAKAEGKVRS